MPFDLPPEAREALPGVAGAMLSALFLKGPWRLVTGMTFGGIALAFYVAPVLADWFSAPKAAGALGFGLGLFGMAIVAKIHEAIQSFAAGDIGKALIEKFRKMLGLEPKNAGADQ